MLASLASVSISVTNVLAVETSERMVHRRCHRALRVLGSTHPTVVQMENSLQNARAILGARESGREVKIIR